jgi:hypothetical protein
MNSDETIDLSQFPECTDCLGYGSVAKDKIDEYHAAAKARVAELQAQIVAADQRLDDLKRDLEWEKSRAVRAPACPACGGWCRQLPPTVRTTLDNRSYRSSRGGR